MGRGGLVSVGWSPAHTRPPLSGRQSPDALSLQWDGRASGCCPGPSQTSWRLVSPCSLLCPRGLIGSCHGERAPSDTLQLRGCASILGAPVGSREGPRAVRGCGPQAGAPTRASGHRRWLHKTRPRVAGGNAKETCREWDESSHTCALARARARGHAHVHSAHPHMPAHMHTHTHTDLPPQALPGMPGQSSPAAQLPRVWGVDPSSAPPLQPGPSQRTSAAPTKRQSFPLLLEPGLALQLQRKGQGTSASLSSARVRPPSWTL